MILGPDGTTTTAQVVPLSCCRENKYEISYRPSPAFLSILIGIDFVFSPAIFTLVLQKSTDLPGLTACRSGQSATVLLFSSLSLRQLSLSALYLVSTQSTGCDGNIYIPRLIPLSARDLCCVGLRLAILSMRRG